MIIIDALHTQHTHTNNKIILYVRTLVEVIYNMSGGSQSRIRKNHTRHED